MSIEEQWVQAAAQEMVDSRLFRFAPARSKPRTLEFKEGGVFGVGARGELERWRVELDETLRKPVLRLYGPGDTVLATLTLDYGSGQWCGRDQRDNGHLRLTCITDRRPLWQTLASQRQFSRNLVVDEEDSGFRYQEPLPAQIDWTPYCYDIREDTDPGVLPVSKAAIAIVGCDRPSYFTQVTHTCAANEYVQRVPVFVFLDYTPKEHTTDQQEELAKRAFPHCVVVRRPRNFGCGRNLIDARRQLFDNLGYERVFVLEDDMVVSSTYFQFCENLLDWGQTNFDNVGAVQGWTFAVLGVGEKMRAVTKVRATYTNWWGYLMTRAAWDTIATDVYRYEELFLGGEYGKRPHRSILDWFTRKMKNGVFDRGPRKFPLNKEARRDRERYFKSPPTGQDAVTMHLFERYGWKRLCPIANRGRYIGRQGIHMTSGWFERSGFGAVTLEEYPGDGELRVFEPAEENVDGGTGGDPLNKLGFRYVNTLPE